MNKIEDDVQDVLERFTVLMNRTQIVFPKFTDFVIRSCQILQLNAMSTDNEELAEKLKSDAENLFEYLKDIAEILDSVKYCFVDMAEVQKRELEELISKIDIVANLRKEK